VASFLETLRQQGQQVPLGPVPLPPGGAPDWGSVGGDPPWGVNANTPLDDIAHQRMHPWERPEPRIGTNPMTGEPNPNTFRGIPPPRATGNLLNDLRDIADYQRAISSANASFLINRLRIPQPVVTVADAMMRPPAGAIGWPYPGFADQAYSTTGIQPTTPSPFLNWVLWGHGLTPDQPRQEPVNFYLPAQGPMPPNDPGGWAR
jgi:hypothetical protein